MCLAQRQLPIGAAKEKLSCRSTTHEQQRWKETLTRDLHGLSVHGGLFRLALRLALWELKKYAAPGAFVEPLGGMARWHISFELLIGLHGLRLLLKLVSCVFCFCLAHARTPRAEWQASASHPQRQAQKKQASCRSG